MYKTIISEEDLPEELLDEHAQVLRVRTVTNLEKNMSGFQLQHWKLDKSLKVEDKKSRSKSLRKGDYLKLPETLNNLKTSWSSKSPESHLQKEIKGLLHKAMRIRKASHDISLEWEEPSDFNTAIQKIRKHPCKELTMKDIQMAEIHF